MVADRFFATQRVLGVMQILGGLFLLAAPVVAQSAEIVTVNENGQVTEARPHGLFVGMLLLHMLCYMPTLGLTNTLAFHNLRDAERHFPLIRVLGTIGWIVAGWTVGLAMQAAPEAERATTP